MLYDVKIRKIGESLAEAIVDRRTQLGWTQTKLAAEIGAKQPAIARIESGDGTTVVMLAKIAAATSTAFTLHSDGSVTHQAEATSKS